VIHFSHPALADYRARPPHPDRREGGRLARGGAPKPGTAAQPLVTIVIAVRNGERHLEGALQSVLAQTYPSVELVIADGASTDGTLAILQRHDDQIDRWISEPDAGAFDGMNRGIALASGRFVKIHGHDDLMPPDSVATAVETFFRAEAEADDVVVRSDMEIIDARDAVLHRVGPGNGRRWSPAILHPTWYVPRRIYERFGLYDPSSAASSDYELFFHLRANGVTFRHADRPLAQFRVGGLSTTTLSGLRDGFVINRHYMNGAVATYLLGLAGGRAFARMGLERIVGTDRSNRVRQWVKRALGESM
jgi:glycosyltransferase involved in cell wall biosynthesis